MLRDILDGFVAAGTLALAGSTVWLGRATRSAVREAYRTRVDASAQRVTPHGFGVAETCVHPPTVARADPCEFGVGIPWSLSQQGDAIIGLWSRLKLQNEGAVTALVRFTCPEGVALWQLAGPMPDGFNPPLEHQNEDWLVFPPGIDAQVRFIWWQSANRWALAADAGGVPTTTVVATIRDARGGAVDEYRLTFGAQVLARHPTQDGWVIAPRDMSLLVPNPPLPPVARIDALPRTYPDEQKVRGA
jgi:hypothetical protein